MIEIGQAIDNRNLVEVQRLCGKDKSLWEQASDHVVDTENVDFIANFLKIGVLVTGYALLTLCRKSSIVNSIRHKTIIDGTFYDLMTRSAQTDPILPTEKFMDLLNRMSDEDGVEVFMSYSTEYLFIMERTDLISSRLDALEDRKLLHVYARVHQIREAFVFGAIYQEQSWIESFYDHCMIKSDVYADALIYAGREGINNKIFERLLEEADEGDLQAVQKHEQYADQSEEFCDAIKGAFSKAKPEWTRTLFPHWRVRRAKIVFEENPDFGIFKEITDIIASYAVYYAYHHYGERASIAKKVVDEIIRATSATYWIGIYVANYIGVDEESMEDS